MNINPKTPRHFVILSAFIIFLSACSITKPSRPSPTTAKTTPSLVINPSSTPGNTSTVTSTLLPSTTPTPTNKPSPTYITITPVFQGTPLPESSGVISIDNIDRLTLLARWGQGNPADIIYTPDGKYLVVGTSTGLYFYDPTDFSLIHSIDQPAVSHLAVSPDSQVLAAVVPDQVLLYRLSDWQLINSIRADANSVDFSPDGKILILGINGDPGSLQLCDATTGKYLNSYKTDQGTWAVKFSPRGDYIATGGYSTTIWALDGSIVQQHGLYVSGGWTTSVSFSPDGKFLAEATDYKLHIWHVLDNGRLMIYRNIDLSRFNDANFAANVYDVIISPDGKLVALTLSTGLHIWDLASGIHVFGVESSIQRSNTLAWSLDSQTIALASSYIGVQFWNVDTGESLPPLDLRSGTYLSLAWSPDGHKLTVGAEEGEAYLLDIQDGAVIHSYGPGSGVDSLSFSPDGSTLAVGCRNHIVNIWDISGTVSHTLEGSWFGSSNATFSKDGSFFAASLFDNQLVGFWNTREWSIEKTVSIGSGRVIEGFTLSLNQLTGAISYTDVRGPIKDFIQIISINDGSPLTTLEALGLSRERIYSIAYSPDSKLLAARVSQSSVYVWQTSNWELLYELKYIVRGSSPVGFITNLHDSIAWSPDGQLLAVGTVDGTIEIINVRNEEQKITLSGHTMYVTGVAFSPDGRYLASVSLDGTVMLWGIRQ